MNPRDRAADWEADIVQRFRNDEHAREFIGERDTPMGKSLYLARPIRSEPECEACHSLAAAAPPTLLARYGSDNGFGWQNKEVVGAQVVSVPFDTATANATAAFRALMVSLIAVFVAVFAAFNLVFHYLVLQPVRQIARVADALSVGNESSEDFPQHGAREIDSLAARSAVYARVCRRR